MSTSPTWVHGLWLARLFVASHLAAAQTDATVSPTPDPPDGAFGIDLTLAIFEDGTPYNLESRVVPLTEGLGLNQSPLSQSIINIKAQIVATNTSNIGTLGKNTIALVCCDPVQNSTDSNSPDALVNRLMNATPQPQAIVLYSLTENYCHIGGAFGYRSVLTMSDTGDTNITLRWLQGGAGAGPFQATISGRQGDTDGDGDGDGEDMGAGPGGGHSTVAMSILYSITGLVTLLFLIIIATGAVRAHRNPERYGPRRAVNGRPRQSRAKGLALAVLETIPVVKFRGSDSAGDLESKMENLARDDATSQRSGRGGEPRSQHSGGVSIEPVARGADTAARAAGASATAKSGTEAPAAVPDDRLGCTICTEDFVVGEDVRVLPCNHKFHPTCVDPWLLNVSGTCPLCRLDLRTTQSNATRDSGSPTSPAAELPPPLESDHAGADHTARLTPTPRRPLSHFFRLGSLRQAPPDERMSALRQIATEVRAVPHTESTPEDLSRRARLASSLRDRFRINTRTHTGSGP